MVRWIRKLAKGKPVVAAEPTMVIARVSCMEEAKAAATGRSMVMMAGRS